MKQPGKNTWLVCLLLPLSIACYSQNSTIDSLEQVLARAAEDTNKVLLLDNLCVKYQALGKLNTSVERAEEGIKLAKKLNYPRGEADIYNDLANTYNFKGDYKTAIEYQNLAIPIRIKLNQKKKLAKSYNNTGAFYERLGEYAKALDYNLMSLKIKEELRDSLGIVKSTNNIGNLYLVTKNNKLALQYYSAALQMAEKINNADQIAMSLDHLSAVCQAEKQYATALSYSEKSLEISLKSNNRYMTMINYSNLGALYSSLNRPTESVAAFNKALKMFEEDGDEDGIQSVCLALGQFYKNAGDKTTAIKYFEKCLNNKQHKRELANTYKALAELYESSHDYTKAFKYSHLYGELQQELYSTESAAKIAEMETKYKTEKKEKENLELKRASELQQLELKSAAEKRKTQTLIATGLVLFTIVVALFILNRRKLKYQTALAHEKAEVEKERFRATIEGEERERSRVAQDLHDGLGQMLSAARLHVSALEKHVAHSEKELHNTALKILDDTCTEVRNISHNMMPNALIKAGLVPALEELVRSINSARQLEVEFNSNVTGSLGKSLDISVYRILQEILNNMMRHAKASNIKINIHKEGSNLEISVRDNGVGFQTEILKESKGMGWKSIFSRVSMLDGTIQLDSKLKEGTYVFIKIRLQ